MNTGITLTENEIELIRLIVNDEYADGTTLSTPWSWSVVNGSKARAGTLSSLCQKGVCAVGDAEGRGRARDQYIEFTDAGREYCLEVLGIPKSFIPR